MGSVFVVVADIVVHESFQMPLMEHDYMVQQVATAGSHPMLRDSILPRTAKCGAAISDAVAILREFRNAADEDILRKLLAAGVERVVASRLVEFLPLAYSRLILSDSGVKFCDRFQRKLADGSLSAEYPLDSKPLWAEIVSFARSENCSGVTGDAPLVIAGRSSEFDAVNQLANRGSKLKDIVLTPTVFRWPEEGLTLWLPQAGF